MTAESLRLAKQQHFPDVLATLAQLPNDEVFTPPKIANAMLDILPDEVWSNPDYRWLDPATKSGVFLREIFKRLMVGLRSWQPDPSIRREHILRTMLYGAAITSLSADIARRSVYQTKDATGAGVVDTAIESQVVTFDDPDGNIKYVQTEHTLDKNNRECIVCKAPVGLIRQDREHFAYSFTHKTYPTKEIADMKFDVIVGNPPYQIGVEGNTRTKPIYQQFIMRAIEMAPKYVLLITPSRWFTGGLGLDGFRRTMLSDRHLAKIVDNPKLFDVFPQVEIKGGVSYFLWDRDHDGDCEFSTRIDGTIISTMTRDLREGRGVLVRDNQAGAIVSKVERAGEATIESWISSQKPFGLLSNFSDYYDSARSGSIRLYKRDRAETYIDRSQVTQGRDLIDKWKVLTPEAADGHGRVPAAVTGYPFVAEPGSACTQTFLVAGAFDSQEVAEFYAVYLRTRFVRFLVHQRKASHHTTSETYRFVPAVPLDRAWTDATLFERYKLTPSEISYIESQIKSLDESEPVEDVDEADEADEE